MAKVTLQKWLNQLFGGAIQGGATSASAVITVSVASSLGAQVQALDIHQLKWAFIGGALGAFFMVLKKKPLPNYENTDSFSKKDFEK